MDRLCHLAIVREQRPVLASPHSLSQDATSRNARKHRRGEENIVDLAGFSAIPEGPWAPIGLELRMDKNVLEVRALGEQRLQWVAVRRVVKVPDNGDQVDPLRPALIIDLADSLCLRFSPRVR